MSKCHPTHHYQNQEWDDKPKSHIMTYFHIILYYILVIVENIRKKMVNEDEIIRVAELMKIDLEDHSEHVARVKKMLEYFDILDQIDLSSEEITSQQKSLDELRKDEFIPNDKKLIESLKNFREHYIRAPKMN